MLDLRPNRKQLFVDKDVQRVLLARVGVYWACCLITVLLLLLTWRNLVGPSRELHVHLDYIWYHYRPIIVAAFILLPILLTDTLRLSNRFAGPMARLKRGLSELADGRQDVAPIHFRRGDFWHEFACEFNRAVQRLQQDEALRSVGATAPEDTPARRSEPAAYHDTEQYGNHDQAEPVRVRPVAYSSAPPAAASPPSTSTTARGALSPR